MGATVLSVASRAVLAAYERLGLDGDALIAAAGLTRADLADVDRRIEASAADALWGAAYARARDPHLALHAAEALPFGAYKVIDYLAAHSASVGEAIERLASYFEIVDTRALLVVHEGERIELAMSTRSGAPVPPGAQEYTFAAIATRMRAVAEAFAIDAVELAMPAPPDPSEHARIFAAPLRFDAAQPRLCFSRAAWATRMRAPDPQLLSILEAHAAHLRAALPKRAGLSAQAHDACLDDLRARREPSVGSIAKTLAVSERTLQRRLREEGTRFAVLLDEARASLSRAYLRDDALSLAEIAWLVGFADQSTFTRAFKRWTGSAPGQARHL